MSNPDLSGEKSPRTQQVRKAYVFIVNLCLGFEVIYIFYYLTYCSEKYETHH